MIGRACRTQHAVLQYIQGFLNLFSVLPKKSEIFFADGRKVADRNDSAGQTCCFLQRIGIGTHDRLPIRESRPGTFRKKKNSRIQGASAIPLPVGVSLHVILMNSSKCLKTSWPAFPRSTLCACRRYRYTPG
jgi:hypothetical protein